MSLQTHIFRRLLSKSQEICPSKMALMKRCVAGSGHSFCSNSSSSSKNNISDVKFYQSAQSISFYFICDGETKSGDPSLNFILSNAHLPSHATTDLDISNGLTESVVSQIEKHYSIENSGQFVGGMGENDDGVWISAISTVDTLDYWEVIADIVKEVKEQRHGVPFGVYTSGILKDPEIATRLKSDIGLSSVEVSLLSDNPEGYASIRGIKDMTKAQEDFGKVCNFIVTAAESGFPVVAALAGGKNARGGAELAKSLGAVDTVVYRS